MYRKERHQYEMEIQSVHNTALQKMRNLHLNPTNGITTLIWGFILQYKLRIRWNTHFCTFVDFSELSYIF